ncbi:MAG: toxin-antitoxin system YwqK family antitoxin [Bacteroidales bacterium]
MMRSVLFILFFLIGFAACTNSGQNEKVLKSFSEKVIERYPNGQPKKVKYFSDEDGKQIEKEEIGYYENGAVMLKGKYKNGLRDGLWQSWYQDGIQWTEGEYKNGRQNGRASHWNEDGTLLYQGQYKNDARIGTWKFYNKDGSFKKEITY